LPKGDCRWKKDTIRNSARNKLQSTTNRHKRSETLTSIFRIDRLRREVSHNADDGDCNAIL
jgi:hypothetical protein